MALAAPDVQSLTYARRFGSLSFALLLSRLGRIEVNFILLSLLQKLNLERPKEDEWKNGAEKKERKEMRRFYVLCFMAAAVLSACREDVDTSARYVFRENTIMSYLQNHPESYSTYTDILYRTKVSELSQTTLGQLLSARGHYTVFAPTNEAIEAFLDTLVVQDIITEPSWEAFTDSAKLDSVRRVIAYNSIIDSGDADKPFHTYDFPTAQGGEITIPNMANRKLTFYYDRRDPDAISVFNRYSVNVRNRDIMVLNGVIHQMEGVIAPRNVTAWLYIQDILDHQREGYLVMARAIQACGLRDTLSVIRDEKYEEMYKGGDIPDLENSNLFKYDGFHRYYAPQHRLHGFTIFAETDDFWRSQGFDPKDPNLLQGLVRWIEQNKLYGDGDVFTTDDHYSDPKNLLYQWVTYHILPQKMASNKLVAHYNEIGYDPNNPEQLSVACYDIYVPLGPRRLLKIYESKESEGVYLNRFPNLDNGRTGTYHELSCDADKRGCLIMRDDERAVLSDIINANIYPLEAPLSYNEDVRRNLMKQRIRFEAQSLFPEAITNDIRLNGHADDRRKYVFAPQDNIYRYFDNIWQTQDTYTVFFDYEDGNPSNMADEIKVDGHYDITLRLPPVPKAGTYELRYAIVTTSYRGVCQIYLSKDLQNRTVTGIPTDMRISVKSLGVWEPDTEDLEYNAEVDKRLRSIGYMKGCQHTGAYGNINLSMRVNNDSYYTCMRQIIARQYMKPDETYYLTFKNVLDAPMELYLDYFEFCAKEVYDNPEVPEDIW